MSATPPAEPRRRVRLQPEARREQIVREATRLIGEAGCNAVSLADVAEACGIRKPSVLHYFPSMHQLLEGVLRQRDVNDTRRHLQIEDRARIGSELASGPPASSDETGMERRRIGRYTGINSASRLR